jgi:hypothetical protein
MLQQVCPPSPHLLFGLSSLTAGGGGAAPHPVKPLYLLGEMILAIVLRIE